MELRFLHGDFGNIKYKLQYRNPCPIKNEEYPWHDVPVVEEPCPSEPCKAEGVTMDELYQAIARGYCSDANKRKVLDHDIIVAISKEIWQALQSKGESHGGK